jgi:hypothetical protein
MAHALPLPPPCGEGDSSVRERGGGGTRGRLGHPHPAQLALSRPPRRGEGGGEFVHFAGRTKRVTARSLTLPA